MCAHTFTGSAVCAWNTLFNNSCVSRSCHCWSSHCIIIIVVIEWMRSECWLISIALSAKTFKRATAAVAAPNAHQVEMLKSSASWLTVLLFFANAIVKMRIIAFWLSKSEMEAFRYFAQHTHTQKVTGVKSGTEYWQSAPFVCFWLHVSVWQQQHSRAIKYKYKYYPFVFLG